MFKVENFRHILRCSGLIVSEILLFEEAQAETLSYAIDNRQEKSPEAQTRSFRAYACGGHVNTTRKTQNVKHRMRVAVPKRQRA